MSEEEIEDCFCFVHENEDMNHYRECLECGEKLCELCIAFEKACDCGKITEKDKYKKIYITKGEIEFEMCKSHLGYQCHYYCNSCSNYICILCSRDISHKSHRVIVIDDYIQLQNKNISNQKENIQKVLENIQIKESELELKREQLINYLNESKQKIQQNLQKFLESVNESLQEKRKVLEQNSISDIIALKNELLFRKQELENRKRFIVNFQNFISDVNNAKLLPFINPEHFFNENIDFANEINENIDFDKKYFYNKIIIQKQGRADNFKIKETKRNENIKIEPFNLPFNLKSYEIPN